MEELALILWVSINAVRTSPSTTGSSSVIERVITASSGRTFPGSSGTGDRSAFHASESVLERVRGGNVSPGDTSIETPRDRGYPLRTFGPG